MMSEIIDFIKENPGISLKELSERFNSEEVSNLIFDKNIQLEFPGGEKV